jgi:predicted outer membrane repeat protein
MKNILTILIFLSIITPLSAQTTWFVQQTATGTNAGTSWSNAFTDLQTALATANNGDAIWVAKGTYTPTSTTDRTISFRMKNGVKIYGGFWGSETTLSARNWTQNATILSGNIGSLSTQLDNALQVVTAYNIGKNSVLDGFTISDAYNPDDTGGGMVIADFLGTIPTEPLIENCTFTKNYAYSGGGMYIVGSASNTSFTKPQLKNCLFQSNRAFEFGGGIYHAAPSIPNDTFLMDQCRFLDNRVVNLGQGGAIYFGDMANSVIKLYGCAFERDSAISGGAIECLPGINAILILDSCAFKHNIALEGGVFHYLGSYMPTGNTLYLFIKQSIFEDNKANSNGGGSLFIFSSNEASLYLKIDNSIFTKNKGRNIDLEADNNSNLNINVSNTRFIQNTNSSISTRVNNASNFNTSSTVIENCVFMKNGLAIGSSQLKEKNFVNTIIRNSTFFQNKNGCFYKSTFPNYISSSDSSFNNRMLIENCVVWQPSMGLGFIFGNQNLAQSTYVPSGVGFTVKNSLLSFEASDTTELPGNGRFYEGNIFEKYPEFMDTLTDNYRLKPCSPLINKGSNASVLANGILYDLDGLPRIQQDTVDMGAYEQSIICASSTHNYAKKDVPLAISPNPSDNGDLCIHINGGDITTGQLTVLNTVGNIIYRKECALSDGSTCLPLQHLPESMYFVSFETEDTMYIGKWLNLKQK